MIMHYLIDDLVMFVQKIQFIFFKASILLFSCYPHNISTSND